MGAQALTWCRAHAGAALILALAAVGGACRPDADPAPPRTSVRFTSGAPGAGFIRLAEGLAREYERALPHLRIEVLESEGATSNVETIQRGEAEIGLGHVNITYVAYLGRMGGQTAPFTRLRGIATLHRMSIHALVRPGAGIDSVAELRGRILGLGLGRGTVAMAESVLGAFGLTLQEVRVAQLPYDEVPERFRDGSIDAHLVTGSHPLDAVTAAVQNGARLLPIDGPAVDRLHAAFPFIRRTLIPAGAYPGPSPPTRTIGVDSLLLCRADLDESLVYDLTRVLFEALPALSSLRLPPIDLDQAPATLIPLHAGAARFYRERELSR